MLQKTQVCMIKGVVGEIECRVGQLKPGLAPRGLVVVCHPHPLYDGSMNNKVVTTIEKAFSHAGWQTLAFNFRGVGQSEGFYDHGVGEQLDLSAVVNWAQGQFGDLPLALAGFSFGSYICLQQAKELGAHKLLTVAPPVNLYDFADIDLPVRMDWSLIQGGQDEVVPAYKVANWMRGIKPRPDVYWREPAGHYFHGELLWLRKVVALTL